MKRAEKIEKELKAIFKDKISDNDLMEFAWGFESIKRIIQEKPYLRISVDFEKIKEDLVYTYKTELRGEMEVLFGNTIIKAPRILGSSTIYRLIPQIMNELNTGIVRPEFRRPELPGVDTVRRIESLDTIDGDFNIVSLSKSLPIDRPHHPDTIRYWIKAGKMVDGRKGDPVRLIARLDHGELKIKKDDLKSFLRKINYFRDQD